jgi:hypothetical protein
MTSLGNSKYEIFSLTPLPRSRYVADKQTILGIFTVKKQYKSNPQSYGVRSLSSSSVEVESLLTFLSSHGNADVEKGSVVERPDELRSMIDKARAVKNQSSSKEGRDDFDIIATEAELSSEGKMFPLEKQQGKQDGEEVARKCLWVVEASVVEGVVGSKVAKCEAIYGRRNVGMQHRFAYLCPKQRPEGFVSGVTGDVRGE